MGKVCKMMGRGIFGGNQSHVSDYVGSIDNKVVFRRSQWLVYAVYQSAGGETSYSSPTLSAKDGPKRRRAISTKSGVALRVWWWREGTIRETVRGGGIGQFHAAP
jgi:hypothetical protein